MKELQERIKKDGIAVNEDILKVDSFINHQVDPVLMQHIGEAFAEHFKDQGITKVATIESSGSYDSYVHGSSYDYLKKTAF